MAKRVNIWGRFNKQSLPLLEAAVTAIHDKRSVWPLTLRHVFYTLAQRGVIEKTDAKYDTLGRILLKARFQGYVPWESMVDRTRSFFAPSSWPDPDEYVLHILNTVEDQWRRDILQDQPVRPEIWVEKDSLASFLHDEVGEHYGVGVMAAKGFGSGGSSYEGSVRIRDRYARTGQRTRILYLTDFDPWGHDMPGVERDRLWDGFGLQAVVSVDHLGLTREQVEKFGMPLWELKAKANPKTGRYDQRIEAWRRVNGMKSAQLDGVEMKDLAKIAEDAIRSSVDLDLLKNQIRREAEDRTELLERLYENLGERLGRAS